MKWTKRIHNFIYAVTHANALIRDKQYLASTVEAQRQEIQILQAQHAEDQRTLKDYRENNAERLFYERQLVELGALPGNWATTPLNEQIRQVVNERLGARKMSSNEPVGRIDYLAQNGKVGETLQFSDASQLLKEAKESAGCGRPFSITVYSDPVTGAHIGTAWVKDLDPPPWGFQVKPYEPIADLVTQFSREQLSDALRLRTRGIDAGEDLDFRRPPVPRHYTDQEIRQALALFDRESDDLVHTSPEASFEADLELD